MAVFFVCRKRLGKGDCNMGGRGSASAGGGAGAGGGASAGGSIKSLSAVLWPYQVLGV